MPDEGLHLLKPSDYFASALTVSTGFRICCRSQPRRRSSWGALADDLRRARLCRNGSIKGC